MPLIVFEGADGTGKSTLSAALLKKIEPIVLAQGKKAFLFREPGGTPIAEDIRSLLKRDYDPEPMCVTTQSLLMFASRRQLLQHLRDLVYAGHYVILDRYIFSTYVYQCLVSGFDPVMFQDLVRMVQADKLVPDYVVFLTSSALKTDPDDAMEKRFAGKQSRLRSGYDTTFDNFYDIFHYYDTTKLIRFDITGTTPEQACDTIASKLNIQELYDASNSTE